MRFSFFLTYHLIFSLFTLTTVYGQSDKSPLKKQEIGFECIDHPKIILEKCDASFIPVGGNEDEDPAIPFTTITARVDLSHYPNLKGSFKFILYEISTEPGYCMNAPKVLPTGNAEDSNSWLDLQIHNQGGFQYPITKNGAITVTSINDNLTSCSVKVKSYDYGAHAQIKVEFYPQGTSDPNEKIVGIEEGSNVNVFTRIPRDDNKNYISDGSVADIGPGASFQADDDNEEVPVGASTGDGIIRYEEYRGFVVNGQYKRLLPQSKDVFIYNFNIAEVPAGTSAWFTSDRIGINVHVLSNIEKNFDREVNFNHETAHLNTGGGADDLLMVYCIEVVGYGNPQLSVENGELWGLASCDASDDNWTPFSQNFCTVYNTNIKNGVNLELNPSGSIMNASQTNMTVSNNFFINDLGIPTPIPWGYNGSTKIDDEIIQYEITSLTSFTGLIRDSDATSHAPGLGNVKYFLNPADAIYWVFAHEAGHIVNLIHPDENGHGADKNIMNSYMYPGTHLNYGMWDSFQGVSNWVLTRSKLKHTP